MFFEYLQHMFCMRNKETSFPIHTLNWSPGFICNLTKIGSLIYFFENLKGRCRDEGVTIGILKPHTSFRAHVS